jgi:hypothetical protein
VSVVRRLPRPAMGQVFTKDGDDLAGAGDIRELGVVELRSPDRFSDGGAGSMPRVPPLIRAIGAVRRILQIRGCHGSRRDAFRRARDQAIGCGPEGPTEKCSEERPAKHVSIVTGRRYCGQRMAEDRDHPCVPLMTRR